MVRFRLPLARAGSLAAAAGALLVSANLGVTAAPTASALAPNSPTLRLESAAAMTQAEEDFTTRVFRMVNRRRVRHGLHRVKWNSCVNGFSDHWASYLVGNDLYEHSHLKRLLYRCNSPYVEENIAKLSQGASPRLLVRLWMHSPEHRDNILNKQVTAGGLSIRWDSDRKVWIAVENFARRPGSLSG